MAAVMVGGGNVGGWTARLTPAIEPWFTKNNGEVNVYIFQFLSGNGYFSMYLHRMGKAQSPFCKWCDKVQDDACHTLFQCARFQ